MSRAYRPNPVPYDQYAMTHEEIADVLGVTRGAIYEAERAALRKCRRICARRGLKVEDFLSAMRVESHDSRECL